MAERGEAGAPFPVCQWPACKPAPDQRVFVLALLGFSSGRPEARAAARLAARQALAAQLGQVLDAVQLHAPPGQPPQVLGRPDIGLSFSHESGISVVAVNLDGPVGVDVLGAEPPPDWAAVARDYLGPQAATEPAAFAPAWAALEAQLKCCGQALTEWSPERESLLAAACRSRGFQLPSAWPGFVAALALPRS